MSTQPSPSRVLYCESSAKGTIGGSPHCRLYPVEHLDRSQLKPAVPFRDQHALVEKFGATARTIGQPGGRALQLGSNGGPLALVRQGLNFGKFLATVASHVAFLRRERIALVHLNNSITRPQGWMLATRLARVPCVVHERDLGDAYTALDRWYPVDLNHVIPMSAWIRDQMVARGVPGENMRVMYDGLDPSSVKVGHPPETLRREWQVEADVRLLGIVGNVGVWKGQESVVRAVIEVARAFPKVLCSIVGAAAPADQAYLANLKALAAQAGLDTSFRFTGYHTACSAIMARRPVPQS